VVDAGVPLLAVAALIGLVWRLRSARLRLDRVACAEHELRGAVTALALIGARAGGEREATAVQLDRLCAGLADLRAARGGERPAGGRASVDLARFAEAALAPWSPLGAPRRRAPGPRVIADRGRLAQALGNLVANAAEHGTGGAELRTRRMPSGVRLEVRNRRGPERAPEPGRGRGMAIAERAARELGGRLDVRVDGEEVVAALDLPAEQA
jgi:signal transduction histidine kinase